jgi:N-methylhydantoinase A
MKKPPFERIARGASAPLASASRGRRRVWLENRWVSVPIYAREALRAGNRIAGPGLVEEHASTTLLRPGDRLQVDSYGNLVIEVGRP